MFIYVPVATVPRYPTVPNDWMELLYNAHRMCNVVKGNTKDETSGLLVCVCVSASVCV